MGYRFDNTATVGPNVGGNSYSGGVNVGGNPNVHAAITSAASLLQDPFKLAIIAAVVLAGVYLYIHRK